MQRLHEEVKGAVLEKFPAYAKTDAASPFDKTIEGIVLKYVARAERDVGGLFNEHARDVAGENGKALTLIGIQPSNAGLGSVVSSKREENIRLVEKAYRAYADDVREIFSKPETFGLRVEDLAAKLEERGNVSTSRASLIARDQTLKLNGAITKTRQENAGVERYTWSTSLDERVRPEHVALEGKEFAWNAPPAVGHPGEDFQCRCVAIPVIPEIGGQAGDIPVDPGPVGPPPPEPPAPPAPPPPPPPEVETGTHTKAVSSVLPDRETRALLSSIADESTLDYLKKTPLGSVVIEQEVTHDGDRVLGLYEPGVKRLSVAAKQQFGQPWAPGRSWSTTVSMPTEALAREATLRHELGHHIHLEQWGQATDEIVEDAFDRATASKVAITEYARTNRQEYFAESYAAYYLRKADLLKHDPNGFRMVEDVLRKEGILKP